MTGAVAWKSGRVRSLNKRFRQWMRASEMLERHDPSIIATIKGERDAFRKIVVFRESALNAMKKEYGDDLRILFGGDE